MYMFESVYSMSILQGAAGAYHQDPQAQPASFSADPRYNQQHLVSVILIINIHI